MEVKTTPNWAGFPKALQDARKYISKSAERETKRLADETSYFLITSINNYLFNLAPLTKEWAKRKNQGEPILVNERDYINDIAVRKDKDGYRLGFSKLKLMKLAGYLEYGTSRMPSRPHWRPALEYAKLRAKDAGLSVLKGVIHLAERNSTG